MVQNNQMGAMMAPPPAAPANPTAVNFQSDPSMRAQFKGFMSGLSAQRTPSMQAPMQSPMTAPLPMPAPMQSVDIFQAQPMQMQMGGAVPRQTMMGGMPHMLSYITPGEAAALSAMGGTGQPGPGGVPSFVYDEAGMGFSSSSSPSMGDASFDYSGGGSNDFDAFQDSSDSFTVGPLNQGYSGAGATAARNLAAEQTAARDALSDLLAAEALKQDRQKQEDLARDITKRSGTPEIEEGFGPYSQVIGTTKTPFAENNIKSIRDSIDTIFDIDTTAPDLLSLDAFGPSGPNLDFSDPTLAPTNARTVDIANPIGVPSQVQFMRDAAKQLDSMGGQFVEGPIGIPDEIQMRRDANAALNAPVNAPAVDTGSYDAIPDSVQQTIQQNLSSLGQLNELGAMGPDGSPVTGGRQRTEAGRTNRIADSGFGPGEIYDAAGSRQPADRQGFFTTLLDTMTGRQFPTDAEIQQGIVDATNARTTITGDERRQDMSALDQLAKRAGQQGTGILGAFTNFSARNAANMYDDIVNKGYEPIYDNRGQIVATRVPGTDILGRGSVEGRIPGANTGGGGGGSAPAPAQVIAEEIEKISNAPMASYTQTPSAPAQTSPAAPAGAPAAIPGLLRSLGFGYGQYRPVQGISANLNSAADDFLNLLSGSSGVQNFRFGGEVDEEEAELSEAITGSYTTSGGGQATGFSYDDGLDGGDSSRGTSVSASVSQPQDDGYKINTTQANQMNEQAKKDAVARDIAMEQQRRAAEAAQRGQNLQASIDRLNQLREGVQAPQQGIMSGVADLLGFGSNQNLLSADLSQQGMGTQTMTPNTSVMGYNQPTGQIAEVGGLGSVVKSRDPSQSGIAGTANVSTQREGFGFSMPSFPSLSQVIDRVVGPTDTYDMSRMTSR